MYSAYGNYFVNNRRAPMRRFIKLAVFVAVVAIAAVPVFADTLVLKNGERLTGYFEGGSARMVKFRTADGVLKDFDILSVQQIQFGDPAPKPTTSSDYDRVSPSAARNATPSGDPRLLPSSERPPAHPASGNAANTGWTIPTGSKIIIRMIDSVNSEKNKVGDAFVATLDEAVVVGGIEVIPRNADIRGRIATINEAGRVAGAAQLGLELTQVIVNGI